MNIKTSLNVNEFFVVKHAGVDSFRYIEEKINQSIICFSVFENGSKFNLIWPADYDGPNEQVVWDLWEGKQTNAINVLKVFNDTSEHYSIVDSFDFIFNTDTLQSNGEEAKLPRCPICHNQIVDFTEHKLVHGILSNKVETPTMLPNQHRQHKTQRVMTVPESVNRSDRTSHDISTGDKDKQIIHLDNDLINQLYDITGVDITYYKCISVFAYDSFINYHGPINLPTDKDKLAWEKFEQAMKGGYKQLNQYCVDATDTTHIFDIDAKSMYPSCMQLYKYPDWKSVEMKYDFITYDEIWNAPIDGEYGYLVDFSYTVDESAYDYLDDLPLTVTYNKTIKKYESTLKTNRTVDLWITMQWMRKCGYNISINSAVKYSQSYVFGDYMEKMLTVRNSHPELDLIIKRMMNSLYGNFLQQRDYSIREKPALDPLRNEQLPDGKYRVLNTKSILQHPKYLSIICLMWSKYRLRQQFYTLKDNLKNVKLVATFVDSLVFTTESDKQDVDKYVSNQSKLGEWCYHSQEPIEKYICLNLNEHLTLTESSTDKDVDKISNMMDQIEKLYNTRKLTNTREIYKNKNNELVTRAKR